MVQKKIFYYKLAGLWLASLFVFQSCSAERTGPTAMTIAEDFGSVSVAGITPGSQDQFSTHLKLFITDVNGEVRGNQSAIIGAYTSQKSSITFTPIYPLLKGKSYLIRYDDGKTVIDKAFDIPFAQSSLTSAVDQVYPSIDVLPLNILKFYIQFSDSMARGFAYDNIHFINAQGDTLDEVYLDLAEELWSSDMKRFTLLLDPGRIKRGLQSLEDLGYVFEQNGAYTLVINKGWHTADDLPMASSFQKEFKTTDFIERYTSDLRIASIPAAHSKEALRLSSKQPNDYGLLQRVIQVRDAQGRQVGGTIGLGKHELSWEFTPAEPWKNTAYQVRIESILEDLAGNNSINPFDVDNQKNTTVHDAPEYSILNWKPGK